jgi:hypothetical protein
MWQCWGWAFEWRLFLLYYVSNSGWKGLKELFFLMFFSNLELWGTGSSNTRLVNLFIARFSVKIVTLSKSGHLLFLTDIWICVDDLF